MRGSSEYRTGVNLFATAVRAADYPCQWPGLGSTGAWSDDLGGGAGVRTARGNDFGVSGADRDRTGDPLLANPAWSMAYGPAN